VRLDRPLRYAKHCGGLGDGQINEETEHQNLSLRLRQLAHGVGHRIAVEQALRAVAVDFGLHITGTNL
jgi:hypothetical protein